MINRAIAVFALALLPQLVYGATLYLDPAMAEINRSDSITVAVRIDTDEGAGECINAVDGVLTYSESIQPVDISLGSSIFSIWVEPPTIDTTNRTITFAGGIPNGYCGRIEGDPRLSNIITQIVFRSPGLQIGGGEAADQATIAFSPQSQVFLNDGQGTVAPLRTFGTTIALNRNPGSTIVDTWQQAVQSDNIPPEEFTITLLQDDKLFNGQYFIIFNTTDKQTGLSHYEVMEEPLTEWGRFTWGGTDAPWIRTRSPYQLKDQSLNSTIRVRALDKAGNEYVATLVPEESLRRLSDSAFTAMFIGAGVAIVLIVIIALVVWMFVRRRRAKLIEAEEVNSTHENTL